jgi:hypothetical protein
MNESEEHCFLMTDPAPTLPVGKVNLLAFPKSNRPMRPYAYRVTDTISRQQPSTSSAY